MLLQQYDLVSKKTEYLYDNLPAEFGVVKNWFTVNPTKAPVSPPITEVEIDDYDSGGKKYEVEFYLAKDFTIIAAIVNDTRHNP